MDTKGIYYRIKRDAANSVISLQYTVRDKKNKIQIGKSLPIDLKERDFRNIKKMKRVEMGKDFLFWNNSEEGIRFFKGNMKVVGQSLTNFVLSQK